MAGKKAPDAWFWSHDIRADQVGNVVSPGMHLMRLASYGGGERRRFAALVYQEAGPERRWALDLTVDEAPRRRFSIVVQHGPGPLSSVQVGLDDDALRALVDDHHCIADLVTYADGGARRYAAIVEERPGPSWVLTGVTAHELDARLLELGAALVRLRSYSDGGQRLLAAVAERPRAASWAWYADLDADTVARSLESNDAYPIDLDAVRDERGVRFTVIMVRGH
jgi:hypothetical protein